MSETIGERVFAHAIAEYKTMRVTGKVTWLTAQSDVFAWGYMKGYLRAQDDMIAKMKEGKA